MSLSDFAAAIVRGDARPPDAWADVSVDAFLDTLAHHAVGPLVAWRLAGQPDVPSPVAAALAALARDQAAADLARESELRACLEILDRAGVTPLLMKGAALAYTHYPRPDLRPRVDTDILIHPSAAKAAEDALVAAGYQRPAHVTGQFVMPQATYKKWRGDLLVHAVDVHWQVAIPHAIGRYLEYDELVRAAVPVSSLGPSARALSDVHALLVGCVHRVAHHHDADFLIWLYDIHLLASRFHAETWRAFEALAANRGVAAICRRSLERTIAAFATNVPARTLVLADAAAARPRAAVASAFLHARRRHIVEVFSDVRALPGWSARYRLVREHLLPPAEYMRAVYAPTSGAPLAVLYLWRAWRGARKWLARSA